ncbi:MBL fold metallo-hydrolase [Nocardioides sp. KR10-350]|uniref:MBL fold metallo-hydrolase n=1 Tax=Nocardioides cheoyonin TaxID=3156615 RepID=UPI0032B50006
MTGRFVEVVPGAYVATSRRMTTTSTLLVTGDASVLVDPAWLRDELDAIAEELEARGVAVTAGFSTHAHHDHLLWHPRYGDVPRWAAPKAAALAVSEETGLREELGGDYPDEVLALFAKVTPLPGDVVPGTELEVAVHDGHAPGHAALLDPRSGVLVAGDMLSDVELPLPFWPDDLPAYVEGLDQLEPYVARASVLVPGHGTPSYAPIERLDADRRYLDDVMSGRVPDDPRMGNEGMEETYEHLVRMVRGE